MNRMRCLLLALGLPLAAAAPAAAQLPVDNGGAARPAARALPPAQQEARGFQVLGRGPVSWTRSTGLAVFRGVDGRDYAYTATAASCAECPGGRMYAWDVTDPARPTLTDSVQVDARVISDVAVNASGTRGVLTREGSSTRRNGLVLLDLSEPAHPRVGGEYWETLLGGAYNPTWHGSHIYVVDGGTQEMVIVDATNPNDPRELGRWGVPNALDRDLQHVAVDSGLAYLAGGDDGVVVVDVGNGMREGTLRRPRLVSQFRYRTEWRGQRWGNTHWVLPHTNAAGAKLLFVADEILPGRMDLSRRLETAGYLHVLDVSDPGVPREVAHYAYAGSGIRAMEISGDTLYLAAHGGGVRALDVSGSLRGALREREIGFFSMGGEPSLAPGIPYAWDVAVHNGLVYATDANSGLWIARPVPVAP